jgi:predicted dehydrogenase
MMKQLRVGVIGLGTRWRKRYQPALLALQDRFRIRALCDTVRSRADEAAKHLECTAAAGPTEMLEDDAIDALLLLDTQWYGWWPVQAACRYGKPVFCAAPFLREDAHADSLVRQVRDCRLPVMVALAPRLAPATRKLCQLLSHRLGAASVVLCDAACPLRYPSASPTPLAETSTLALVDWCIAVMGTNPVRIQATTCTTTPFLTMLLEFSDGRIAQITRRPAPAGCSAFRLLVSAERGTAQASLPGNVSWAGRDGKRVQIQLARAPLSHILLKRFHEAVTLGRDLEPNLEDAYRVLGLLRAANRSHAEGRQVAVTE